MLLGFISLLLTVGTTYIAMICVPEKLATNGCPVTNHASKFKRSGVELWQLEMINMTIVL